MIGGWFRIGMFECTMFAPFYAAVFAALLPGTPMCAGTDLMSTDIHNFSQLSSVWILRTQLEGLCRFVVPKRERETRLEVKVTVSPRSRFLTKSCKFMQPFIRGRPTVGIRGPKQRNT